MKVALVKVFRPKGAWPNAPLNTTLEEMNMHNNMFMETGDCSVCVRLCVNNFQVITTGVPTTTANQDRPASNLK